MQRQRGRKARKIALILAIIIIASGYMLYQSDYVKRIRYPLKYKEHIQRYAAEYSLDSYLVASVIWVESKYDSSAVSRKNARGLMQLIPETARWGAEKIGIHDFDDAMLFDPAVNIRLGCWYLNYLFRQFPGNVQLVLASYNGGIGNVKAWLENKEYSTDGKTLDYIPFGETRIYVDLVMKTYYIYKQIYPDL
ncbi:MAG TPA: lytic transglycosylase domain-containing protein [Candidatus Atribacteria bacterium]|nr:lytic transglycosylase domain-containing protein [Candidatus Atribacteria bacterium]